MTLLKKFAASAMLALAALDAQAAPITYEFNVSVTGIYDFMDSGTHELASTSYPLGGVVNLGDTFHGKFSFDSSKLEMPAANQTPTSRYFIGQEAGAYGLSFTTPGGATYTSQPSSVGIIQLQNDAYDNFSLSDNSAPVHAGFSFFDWNGGAFDSLALPANMKLSDFAYTWFRTSWFTNTGSIAIDGKFTALAAVVEDADVPEPATWATLLVALAGMGLARRVFGTPRGQALGKPVR